MGIVMDVFLGCVEAIVEIMLVEAFANRTVNKQETLAKSLNFSSRRP
jgi:hypothetical protein